MNQYEALLDIAPVTASEYASIEDRCRDVLGTAHATFVFQGEATVALEAAARGLGWPGCVALNLVSGPYGTTFGNWLSAAGASVKNVVVPFDRAVHLDDYMSALERSGAVDIVSVVHAEAATGVVNDLREIARVARSRGALVVVDAVASVGAEPLAIDAWGIDLVVLGAQKALAGPSGASMVVATEAAWEALVRHPAPWRGSVLSLLDWRDNWLSTDRSALPVIPSHLETRALGEAIERVAEEGLDKTVARHKAARAATHAALPALGLRPWVRDPVEAASLVTLVRAPAEGTRALLAASLAGQDASAVPLAAAPGPLAEDALRVNHTGRRANLTGVLSALTALARGLHALGREADLNTSIALATEAWRRESNWA